MAMNLNKEPRGEWSVHIKPHLNLLNDVHQRVPSQTSCPYLGPPVVPFSPLFGGLGSPTKIDVQKKMGSLIRTSLLEDLVYTTQVVESCLQSCRFCGSVLIFSWGGKTQQCLLLPYQGL